MGEDQVRGVFVLHGARAAAANGIPHIEEQIAALERAVVENPGLAFDLAKFIVESTCKTILSERKIAFEKSDKLSKLFKAVTTNVSLLPTQASGEAEARRKLLQTLNGLHTALQGVCELRNSCGFTSHGSGGQRPAMEGVQALLAAQAADTIVGFLFSAHRVQRDGTYQKSAGNNPTVDKVLDTIYEPVEIAGQPYAVSEALYATDREAYLAVAATVEESRDVLPDLSVRFPACLRPEVRDVTFVHFANTAYLKTSNDKGEVNLEDTSFITRGSSELFFSPTHSPDENAGLLAKFDPFSIINCFELFTHEATTRIGQAQDAGILDTLFPPAVIPGEAE
jgi:hypothetical protein